MFQPQVFFEAGRARNGVAYWAADTALGTIYRGLGISTRNGNAVVDWGDGTIQNIAPVKNTDATLLGVGGVHNLTQISHTYSSYTGNIALKFLQGLNDVYSINIGGSAFYLNQTWQSFIGQFRNLFSVYIDQPHDGSSYINGDVAIMPDSVERFRIADLLNSGLLNLNLSNFSSTSKLKFFNVGGGQYGHNQFGPITGDLAKIPAGVTLFRLYYVKTGSAITYTAGKVWAHNLETFSVPFPLTTIELDNLLIDMQNSVTSVGAGTYALGGYRSYVSDPAVAYLEGLGRTVSIQKYSITPIKILDLDFQNNFTDTSSSALTMVAGGTSNQPTFALSGRKAGEYCAVFNGSQSIKTTTNLPINSDKVTVAFWMKTTQTGTAIVGEMSPNTNSNNTFSWYINDGVANSVQFNSRNTGVNQSIRTGANNGTWKHFVAVIDRLQNGANEILIYENGALAAFTKPITTDNNGNFVNNILFIGQRAGNTLGFNGSLTRLKIYNYPFTPSEVSNLYNSEL